MSLLIPFYYDTLIESQRVFDDAFSIRFWPSLSAREVGYAFVNPQHPNSFRPRMDVQESKDSNTTTVTFDLPGLRPEDVVIQLQENRLTVSGDHKTSNAIEEDGRTIRERHYGKFSRTLQLPNGTKHDNVKAKLENGLLTVTFPKAAPEQIPQRITIR